MSIVHRVECDGPDCLKRADCFQQDGGWFVPGDGWIGVETGWQVRAYACSWRCLRLYAAEQERMEELRSNVFGEFAEGKGL